MTKHHRKTISVYKICFPDGKYYIGQSKNPKERMYDHWHAPQNARLFAELDKYDSWSDVECKVLRTFQTKEKCDEYEAKLIREHIHDPNNLNKQYGPGGNPNGRKYPGRVDDGKMVRCRICFEWKNASRFHTDRSRSSGIASMCKVCKNRIGCDAAKARNRVMKRWSKEHGPLVKDMARAASESYYRTVDAIREEKDAH